MDGDGSNDGFGEANCEGVNDVTDPSVQASVQFLDTDGKGVND